MAKNVAIYIMEYVKCAKWVNAAKSIFLIPITINAPFELMGMDFEGFFKKKIGNYEYILVIINYFSKYIWAFITLRNRSKNVMFAWKQFFKIHPAPGAIYMDRNPYFASETFKNFFRKFGIVFDFVSNVSHKLIKMIEKTVYIVKQNLRKYMDIYPMIFYYTTMRIMFGINTNFIEHLGYLFENIFYGMESILVFNKEKKFKCIQGNNIKIPD